MISRDAASVVETPLLMIVGCLVMLSVLVAAMRKLAYELYSWFPNALRVYEFQRKRPFLFYWVNRADFSPIQLARLYVLWIVARFDVHFPVIDCERQAAKAQYFHNEVRHGGVRGWHYRRVNPETWPILLMRRLSRRTLAALTKKRNTPLAEPQSDSARHRAGDERPDLHRDSVSPRRLA